MHSRPNRSTFVALLSVLFFNGLVTSALSQTVDPFAVLREQMVKDRVESAGVKNPRVLRAMRETPRHEFVPNALRDKAYFDMALPIGDSQTISSPFIVACKERDKERDTHKITLRRGYFPTATTLPTRLTPR